MQIKPPVSSTSPVTPPPQSAKTAPAAGKPGDFAHLLKAAQADTPAATATPGQG
ncbi:hypothetical protein [Roseateles sp.]|uniref:hypothetical protein n=1 Tax=Roseateles sp. TaxID=1971397 RepID=UPI003BAA0648